jgi:hypothetical protein
MTCHDANPEVIIVCMFRYSHELVSWVMCCIPGHVLCFIYPYNCNWGIEGDTVRCYTSQWPTLSRALYFTSYSSSLLTPHCISPHQFLYSTMPSTFNLGTCIAIVSSILESLSLTLRMSSDPPPYNHAHPSHINHSQLEHGKCQDLWIPVTSSVSIPIPNSISCHGVNARRGREAQSIPMADIMHHGISSCAKHSVSA